MEEERNIRLLEALLFATQEPLEIETIAARFDEKVDIYALLRELKKNYEGHGVQLLETGGRWFFCTAPDLADCLKIEKQKEKSLSQAALETLAIIAYHQPVTRPEIENIRGVSVSGGTIDILVDTGWIKPGRRRQVAGKPLTWVVTPAFMSHFGIGNMSDLPGIAEMKAAGLLDTRMAVDALPDMEDLFGGEPKEDL